MSKILILINEADSILAKVCKNKFKMQEGWESIITSSCQDAIKAFQDNRLDIVITDIILSSPEKSGFDFIKEARQMQGSRNAEVPIVVLSKLGQEQDINKAISLGATKYFDENKMTIFEVIEEIKKLLK